MIERAVLLSITPEFAEMIAIGSKTIELRRRFPEIPEGSWIYFYVTLPVGAVQGRARVAQIDAATPATLWQRYSTKTGLARNRFNAYFAYCDKGFAVRLTGYEALGSVDLVKLRSIIPGFVAPQSYRFLDSNVQASLLTPRRYQRKTIKRMPSS